MDSPGRYDFSVIPAQAVSISRSDSSRDHAAILFKWSAVIIFPPDRLRIAIPAASQQHWTIYRSIVECKTVQLRPLAYARRPRPFAPSGHGPRMNGIRCASDQQIAIRRMASVETPL